MTKLTGRPEKRFFTPIGNAYIIEKVTYDIWADMVFISSYFLDNEVMEQLDYLKPNGFFETQVDLS